MTVAPLETDEMKAGKKLISVVERFREQNPNMQAQMMLIFLLIGTNPGITLKKLEQMTGEKDAIVVRNVQALSSEGYKKRDGERTPGLGLVQTEEEANDRRAKVAYLTPAGRGVFKEFKRILEG